MADTYPTCSIDGCERKRKTRGWCQTHYVRWVRHGDPRTVLSSARPITPAVERLLAKCHEDENGCWVHRNPAVNGYGYIGSGGHKGLHVLGHRVTYEHFRAEIPDGLHIDHLCLNRACCNPWHLEPVTQQVNNQRRWDVQLGRRTHDRES